jgi:hypothetical protein
MKCRIISTRKIQEIHDFEVILACSGMLSANFGLNLGVASVDSRLNF